MKKASEQKKISQNALSVKHVDLSQYPGAIKVESDSKRPSELTLGDSHGNFLKVMYFLIQNQILNIDKAQYQQLVEIYSYFDGGDYSDKSEAVQKLESFKAILAKANINNKHKVRLLGDDIADRRSNDYLTLLLVKKLVEHKVDLEIILSNHSIEFIEALERVISKEKSEFKAPRLPKQYITSMENLKKLIAQEIISFEDVVSLFSFYQEKLRLFSYTVDAEKNRCVFYSHAPVGVNVLESTAKKLNVPCRFEDACAIAETIDQINLKITNSIKNYKLHQLYSSKGIVSIYRNNEIDIDVYPIELAIANFNFDLADRPAKLNDIEITYVHGHEEKVPMCGDHCITLDTKLGLNSGEFSGELRIFTTASDTSKKIQLQVGHSSTNRGFG